MIENDTQYQITIGWVEKFQQALKETKENPPKDTHPLLIQASIDAIESELTIMEKDLDDYRNRKV